jgi:hypothetical protein
MATPTYIPIATVTLATSSSAVYFTEISQDYSDLVLTVEYKAASGVINIRPTFNGDTGSNYSYVVMSGDGSNTASGKGTVNYVRSIQNCSATTTEAHIVNYQIEDYSATDKHKSTLVRGNSIGSYSGTEALATTWANTSAITSIGVVPNTSSFAAGSTFKLFGIHGEAV